MLSNLKKNYLTKRKQLTKLKTKISDECDIEYGVPQESVLGSLLFLIYINDSVNSNTLGEFVLFADDTNIFVTGKDEKSAYLKANIVLEKVHEYIYSNQLHINTENSCYMHIHPSLNSTTRLTCARSRPLNCGLQLKIGS